MIIPMPVTSLYEQYPIDYTPSPKKAKHTFQQNPRICMFQDFSLISLISDKRVGRSIGSGHYQPGRLMLLDAEKELESSRLPGSRQGFSEHLLFFF